jgi:hypothetical protein
MEQLVCAHTHTHVCVCMFEYENLSNLKIVTPHPWPFFPSHLFHYIIHNGGVIYMQ